MDVQMPVVDGHEATRTIREWELGQGRTLTPIIALTASATPDAIKRSLAAGRTDFMTKPITKAALLATLEKQAATPPPASAGRLAEDSQPVAESIGSPVDLAAALEQFNGNGDTLAELARSLIDDEAKIVSTIESAIEKQDADLFRSQAHRLVARLGFLHADPAASLADHAQNLDTSAGFEEARCVAESLCQSVREVARALAAEFRPSLQTNVRADQAAAAR
jgi:two-component system sensor histidine kinase/response regulator